MHILTHCTSQYWDSAQTNHLLQQTSNKHDQDPMCLHSQELYSLEQQQTYMEYQLDSMSPTESIPGGFCDIARSENLNALSI